MDNPTPTSPRRQPPLWFRIAFLVTVVVVFLICVGLCANSLGGK